MLTQMYLKNQVGYWRQLLVDVGKKEPIQVDLDFAARFIAYQTAFLAISGWTLKEKPLHENINHVIAFVLKGLGLSTTYLEEKIEGFDSEEEKAKKPAAKVKGRGRPKKKIKR